MELADWLSAISILIALAALGFALVSWRHARQQTKIAAARRHEETAPVWETLRWGPTTGVSWQLELTVARGTLDRVVLEIHDSPGITFDLDRHPDATADRLERDATMHTGSSMFFWVKLAKSHGRRFRARVTSSFGGVEWEPVLLPRVPVVARRWDQ
ncbi:hypothetical protein JK358_38155 [Nocardia sp. 2]|uniref:DUF2550 family protein n=1 Tax=Nocardia acididurans TaxID=2802282 RepID=A0ABS1MJL0_9NOCA|nr:hypothetical protein [Nocardia acididurans]MBL1080235.1 hypothetical protein [Nocardia acididurans]